MRRDFCPLRRRLLILPSASFEPFEDDKHVVDTYAEQDEEAHLRDLVESHAKESTDTKARTEREADADHDRGAQQHAGAYGWVAACDCRHVEDHDSDSQADDDKVFVDRAIVLVLEAPLRHHVHVDVVRELLAVAVVAAANVAVIVAVGVVVVVIIV